MKKIKIKKEIVFLKGSIAVFALFLMFILTVTTLGIIAAASVERKSSMSTGSSTTAFQVAEKGMEKVEKHFKDNFYNDINSVASALGASCGTEGPISGSSAGTHAATITKGNELKIRFKYQPNPPINPIPQYISNCAEKISNVKIIKVIGNTKNETRTIEQDVFFGATKLLLHLDGKTIGGELEDSSYYYERNNPTTLHGDADISKSTDPQKFGSNNIAFGQGSNSDGYLEVNLTNDNKDYFYFKNEDFTIDFWVYPTRVNVPMAGLVSHAQNGNTGWWVELNNATFKFYAKDSGLNIFQISSPTPITANNWYHIVAVRKKGASNGFKLFVNGQQKGSAPDATMPNIGTSGKLRIGQSFPSALFLGPRGFMDEVRISKGIARFWDNNFTPPSNPYWAD